MTQGEYKELKEFFYQEFEDVRITDRSTLYKIFDLIDRVVRAEAKVSDYRMARDADQWGR